MAKSAVKLSSKSLSSAESEKKVFDAFLKAVDVFDAKHNKTQDAAAEQLKREGILTPTGRLTRRYGG